ncbi:MAG: undecaprenyl/decaprenyl-phosphate alpha-N-acetylglucosaminyl 1-phosphate transferase [Campylobacterales bacterium]
MGRLVTIFVVTWIMIKLLIRIAPSVGLMDIPKQRSIHTKITPRGAGIGMFVAVALAHLLFLFEEIVRHPFTYTAIFAVFIVGLLDDHRDIRPKTKFFVIFGAVCLLYVDGLTITSIGHFFGYPIDLGWLALPFTFFAVSGFTNALNLTDGLDGLAGSISFIILAILAVIGYEHNDTMIVTLSLSFMAALLAFLLFNWNPASIFMGDSGSLTLGFVISLLSIKALAYIEPTSVFFIAALPIIDTLTVIIRRKRSGRPIFAPDKHHLHHVMLHFFRGDVKKTVIFLALLQLLYSLLGLNLTDYSHQHFTLLFFILNEVIFYILLEGMLKKQNRHTTRRNERRKRLEH